MEPLRISDFAQATTATENEISASVDGEIIYVRAPKEITLLNRAEFYIAVALLDAMIDGRDIELDSAKSVSQKFLSNLEEVQSIYACWNHDLTKINIRAKTFLEPPTSPTDKVGSLFSAGIDSSHTLVRHINEIDYLVMLYGIDYGNNEETWARRLKKQHAFAASQGKTLVPLVSNAREWAEKRKISWLIFHGALLCATGRILGLKRLYVPSNETYDTLIPWGSSPVLDHWWSSDDCEIIHDGAAFTRTAKTAEILSIPAVADNIQVCWYHIDHNCGECSKCVRSMLAIYLLKGHSQALPDLNKTTDLNVLKPGNIMSLAFVDDLRRLAKRRGDKDIERKMLKLVRAYQRSQFIPQIDKYLFGNAIKRLYRKWRKPKWLNARVTLEGVTKNDF